MLALADIEEVRIYNQNEIREDNVTIKSWIISNVLALLSLENDFSLGALPGKSFTVEVID